MINSILFFPLNISPVASFINLNNAFLLLSISVIYLQPLGITILTGLSLVPFR